MGQARRPRLRADLIQEHDDTILLHARVNDDISFAIEQLRGQQWGRARVRFTYSAGVADGEVSSVQRTTRAGGTSTLEVTLERVMRPQLSSMRASFNAIGPDDLVEAGLRHQLFGEPLPQAISGGFGFTTDTGVDADDLRAAFTLPNEIVEPITRLVLTEGLVGGDHSLRVSRVFAGPRVSDARRHSLDWLGGGSDSRAAPATRRVIEGDWRV